MRRGQWLALLVIGFLFAAAAWSISVPRYRIALPGNDFERGNPGTPLGLRLGLDLQGGVHLVYETVKPSPTREELEGVIRVIRRRVDAFGLTEPLIQSLGANRVLVQLPGIRDVQAAKDLIGAPARLDFRELLPVTPTPGATPEAQATPLPGATATPTAPQLDWAVATAQVEGREVELRGERLVPNTATVDFDPQTGAPEVRIQFDRDGGLAFEQITERLVQFARGDPRRRLGIFLDDQPVSTPEVQAQILGGRAIITGLDLEEGRVLAIQLNAGAFPTPLKKEPILERDVDPFLGAGALARGLRAGLVGLGLVALFMVLYYRMSGLTAAAALLVYAVVVLAIFKAIPVVLTLAGLAAFVLSMGMAIDANVLIFERMKEELRAGRSLGSAIEIGFNRAWSAIRDSNLTTLIAAVILFWFADRLGAGLVQGFALTLAIGVLLSMFTALFVTRRLLQLFVGTPLAQRLNLFHP